MDSARIRIFTDGSVQPKNPGDGGSGAVILYDDKAIAVGRYLGYNVTNNQAELYGIQDAFKEIISLGLQDEKVILYSDSKYSLGVIGGQYTVRKNKELVDGIITLRKKIPELQLFWCKSHRKIKEAENEKHRELILWNDVADRIAKYSAKTKNYSWHEEMPEKEFLEEFKRIF